MNRSKISLIAAIAANGVIGNNGTLPWHLKKDFAWFVKQTTGKSVVMGRKNYEDIIGFTQGKPLKNRVNIVLSKTGVEQPLDGFLFYSSIEELIAKHHEELMIIGGTQIYEAFLPLAHELILTEIQQDFQGDTYFPQWNRYAYKETFRQPEEENNLKFDFAIYQKV